MSTTYLVTAVREARWWNARLPEIAGCALARRFSQIEAAALELIAVSLGVPLADVHVDVSRQRLR